ncbi:MAG: hypothetical protein V4673_14440 [Pseudomonadota bacterium]
MTKKLPWTDEEVAELFRLRDVEQLMFKDIDVRLNRRAGASWQKYDAVASANGKRIKPEPGAITISVTEQQIAERAARAALSHRTLTAAFFGDPLPGYSALDRRRGNGDAR